MKCGAHAHTKIETFGKRETTGDETWSIPPSQHSSTPSTHIPQTIFTFQFTSHRVQREMILNNKVHQHYTYWIDFIHERYTPSEKRLAFLQNTEEEMGVKMHWIREAQCKIFLLLLCRHFRK